MYLYVLNAKQIFLIVFHYYGKYDFHDLHEHTVIIKYNLQKFEILL